MGIKLLAKLHKGRPTLYNEVTFPGYEPYEIEMTSLKDQVITSVFKATEMRVEGNMIGFWEGKHLVAMGDCAALENVEITEEDHVISIDTPIAIGKAWGFTKEDEDPEVI